MLYHLLPVAFWLLASGGSAVPFLLPVQDSLPPLAYAFCYIPAVIAILCFLIIRRIQRHASSVEECFQVGLLLGIASYWMPSVLFLLIPVWGTLIYRNIFSFRSFLSTLIGLSLVTIWAVIAVKMGWIGNPWAEFFAPRNNWAWIPTGSFLLAYVASAIARHVFLVR